MKPLRWTIEAIGREFKLGPNTVRKILHQGGAEPDANGCYTTEQVVSCLYGNLHAEKIRKERQLVRKYELENAITEGSYLHRGSIMQALAALADALVSAVKTSNLDRQSQDAFLKNLATWPTILIDVTKRQSKLRRSKNGEKPEEDASES
jgi:hypothetical protein